MTLKVTHIENPDVPANPAFAQAVSVEGASRTIYVGGQNAYTANGIVGDDLAKQTLTTLNNLEKVLRASGAELENIVSWTIFVVEGHDVVPAYGAFQEVWKNRAKTPAITVAFVSALGQPGLLCEISAIAVI